MGRTESNAVMPQPWTPSPSLSVLYVNSPDGDVLVNNGTTFQPLRGRDIAHSLQTYSGKFIWPLDPYLDELALEDMAHGTATECRYGNQSPYPYSVAWHEVALSHVVPDHLKQFALIHDKPEAYLKDIPRTIRRQEPFKTQFQAIHDRMLNVCCEYFGIENQDEELHYYDVKMSWCEMAVWAESNIIFEAKMRLMDVDMEDAHDPTYIEWVKKCPIENHWQESEKAWFARYHELFG